MGGGRKRRGPRPNRGSTWVPAAGGAITRWGAEMGSEVKGKKSSCGVHESWGRSWEMFEKIGPGSRQRLGDSLQAPSKRSLGGRADRMKFLVSHGWLEELKD